MKDLLKALMMDKMESDEMDPRMVEAKLEVLKELLGMANESAGKDIASGMQKLTVMAPDKEGLMEGMEKAEEVVENVDEEMMPEDMVKKLSEDDEDEEEDY